MNNKKKGRLIKKKEDYLDLTTGIISGGTGLTLGAGIIEELPDSKTKIRVQKGFSTAGGFISPMINIVATGIVTKQLKNLKENIGQYKKNKREVLNYNGRILC